jgi:excisionase family DNA binding protein
MQNLESALNVIVDAIAARLLEKISTHLPAKKRLVSVREAAALLGCSQEAIRNKVASGELRAVRHDRHLRFDMRDLEQLIDNSKDAA